MLAFNSQTLPDFGKFFSSLRQFFFFQDKWLLFGLELISAILRQLLNDITKLRTTLVARARSLPLASAAGSLRVLAPAAYNSVFFILMNSF